MKARVTAGTAGLAIALLAGCGSTVEPTAIVSTSAVSNQLGQPVTTPSAPGTVSTAPSTPAGTGTTQPAGPSGVASTRTGATSAATQPASTATATKQQGTASASPTHLPSGPISLGFLTTGTSNAGSYGASLGNTLSEHTIDQALVDALNKQGGISGHKINAVYAGTDTGTTNWDTDFQAACADFTQDHHVAAVLGYEFTYEPDFETCLAHDGIPHLSDGFNVPSNSVLANYPYFWSLAVPTIGQRNIEKFEGAIRSGFLTSKDKLGVVLDQCPGTVTAWTSQVEPFLKSHHIPTAPPATFGCSNGNNAETVAEVGQASNALLRFRSEKVNRIAFVSVSEAPVLFISATAAQAQGYRPGWIVSSLGQLAVIGGQSPAAQMANTRGYGWMPSQDVSPALAPPKNAAQKRCLSLLASQSVHPQSAADFGYAYNICEPMFLYIDALKADNGNPSGAAISQAIAGIGTHFQSLINLDGKSDYSNSRRNDAPSVYREVAWSGGCHCFRYQGPTYPMP